MGHCTVFLLKTAKKIIWKNLFTKICPGWIQKAKKFFSNTYCDMLFHASLTKFTGPAKFFQQKNVNFGIFIGGEACREVSWINHPVDAKKKRYKIQKKTPQCHKTWPTELSFDTSNLYKEIYYYFCDISLKIE